MGCKDVHVRVEFGVSVANYSLILYMVLSDAEK